MDVSGTTELTHRRCGSIALSAAVRRQPSLHLNVSWTVAGSVVYAACQWGILIAIARLGTAEMVGQFALAIGIVTPVFMLANLQMRQLHVTDANGAFHRRDYVLVRLATTCLAVCAIAVGATCLADSTDMMSFILCLGFTKAFESFSDLLHGFQQRREQMNVISISLCIRGALSLVLMVIGVWATGNLLVGMFGWLCASAFALSAYDVPAALRLQDKTTIDSIRNVVKKANFPSDYWKTTLPALIRQGLSLGSASFLLSLTVQVPCYTIALFLDDRDLGIYAALAYFTVAGKIVVTALGQCASARLAGYSAAGDTLQFRTLVLKLLLLVGTLTSVGTIAALMIGKDLLRICYGDNYASYHWLLTALVAASFLTFMTSILGVAATASRCFASQCIVVPLGLLVAFCVSLFLVPLYGLYGAVIGHAAGWATLGGGYVVILNRLAHRSELKGWTTLPI